MRLFLLSLLAIGSVHSLTIGYPYRSALLGYNPARGEFPVQSSVVQGYLRYLDSSGVERLVGYSYPEPVQGVRQVSYVSGVPAAGSQVYRVYGPEESSEFVRAREAHFRAWSLQQYQALKREVDALRAEGKEPSADLLAKFQPLERIALTSDYTAIAELPEVKRIRDDHLRLWYEARIQGLQLEAGQQPIGEIKTYAGHNVPLVPAEETPEQKLARQEHLRIYNEQLSRLRQLQAGTVKSQTNQIPVVEQPANRLAAQSDGTTEVERATQEHLRLWNEAKLRAEQASYQQHSVINESGSKAYGAAVDKQVISELKQAQNIPQAQPAAQGSAELQKALQDHVRLVNEAKLQIQSSAVPQVQVVVPSYGGQPQVGQLRLSVAAVQQQSQQVADTPEVVRAREEHLRLVNEARLRAQSVEQDELKHKHFVQVPLLKAAVQQPQQVQQQIQYHNFKTAIPLIGQPATIADTAEVTKAREEHLRLVNEVKLKLQSVEQQQGKLSQQENLKGVLPVQHQTNVPSQIAHTPEVVKAREEHLRFVNEANLKADQQKEVGLKTIVASQYQPHIADTPEVVKAREEHLRLVNEANLKALSLEKQEESGLKTISATQYQTNTQMAPIADTAEVVKAREEHLRLLNEAKSKVQSAEQSLSQQNNLVSQQPQQLHILQQIKETAEVIQARQEHLRIFNEIKAQAEKEQSKISQIKAAGSSVRSQDNIEGADEVLEEERRKEELRLLEVEHRREVERLQEEQKQMELERMREAERLAEEQRQMESELIRLKIEEEQRLEMEKSIETRRLKAQQEQLQQLIITEEYKPTQNEDSFILEGQQPEQFVNNAFRRSDASEGQVVQQQIIQQQQQQEQQYVNNPFLKSIATDGQAAQQQQQQQQVYQQQQQQQYHKSTQPLIYFPVTQPEQSSQTILPGVRYIQSSQQSIGSKQQHLKDDSIKIQSADHAGYQPADTAAVLIHLEKARQEHFRAHEQALEQLRLARVQNPSLKDCN